MEGSDDEAGTGVDSSPPAKLAYDPPRVIWREAFEPVAFGISCAKQPGNPQCNPGPISS